MCQTAVLCWMHDPAGRDAIILKQALSSDSTNLEAVIELLLAYVTTPRSDSFEVDREIVERDAKAVKSEISGKFKLALLTILQCAHNPVKYFAKVLHKAMKGLGTDDTTLTRVIVTRTEIDMQYIKAEY
ncbi:hypothetical protein ACSBR1_016156 [Camellia fascicularis]